MKKLQCVGDSASPSSESLSVCVCTPAGALMREDNDKRVWHTCACEL